MCNVHIILCLDLNYVLNHGLGRMCIWHSRQQNVKCTQCTPKPNVTTKQNQTKNISWTAKFEQTVLFARVCVSLCALQLRLCHGSKQVNSKHIHNFRLIITKRDTHTQQQHSERWNKSDRECEVRARKKEQFCRIVRNENGAPNDLKCSISSHTIFLLFDAMQSLLSLEMCAVCRERNVVMLKLVLYAKR